MKLKPYPKYKPSGLEWQGEAPHEWRRQRLRFAVTLNPSKSETADLDRDTEVSFLPMEAIGDDGSLDLQQARPISKVETGYTYFREGDVTIAKITPCFENGKGARMRGLKGGIGFGTTELIVARPSERLNGEFLHWLFVSEPFRKQGEAHMYGAGGQKRVPDDFVRNFDMAWPPLDLQAAIAVFLDRETAKVDTLIAKQEKLIELLREKRQSVISHAVTKGLDPTVPMKPSDVEWLGDVPAHWDLTRLGWITSEINDINHEMPAAVDVGVPFLSAKDLLDDGTLNFETDIKQISEEDFSRLSTKICPRKNDILYSRIGARLGKARLVETDVRFLVSYSCCVIRVQDESTVLPQYICTLLDTDLVLTEAKARTNGIGVPDLGLGEIARYPIPLPPTEEQCEIVHFVQRQCRQINTLIAKAQQAIQLQKEHRTALISAAVTGKIDVRGLVEQEDYEEKAA